MRQRLLALVGPTASGKTAASIPLAEALEAEIVNIDANLIYRGMDVWTGKPSGDELRRVPHHLLDLTDPGAPVGVARFKELAKRTFSEIRSRGRIPLLVGASGLYYRAVVDDLGFPGTEPATRALLDAEARAIGPEALYRRLAAFDPAAASRIHPNNARRTVRALEVAAITGKAFSDFARSWNRFPSGSVMVAGIDASGPVLHRRIEERVTALFPALLEETAALIERGYGRFLTSRHVMGYAEAAGCLDGRLTADDAVARIVRDEKALARRQRSWFRRDPRIRWFPAGPEGGLGLLDELLAFFLARDRAGDLAEV